MEELNFTNQTNERLDKFLKEKYPEFSRTQWQKIVKQGQILVNNKKTTAHYKLQAGDDIIIYNFPKNDYFELPELDIKIIQEDKNFLVIEKPAGLPIHPDGKYKTNTLIQQLIEKYPGIKEIDEKSERPGIVHRLDKDVSGVMVIARAQKMFDYLKEQFHQRAVYKEYLALVHDPMTKPEDEIKLSLERDKKTGKMKAKPGNQPGKTAITQYEVIKNFTHFSYLKIIIKTGRTHQIRTLLRALDHPIVGDTLYAKKKTKANIDLERPFLHAHKLKFYNQKKEYVEYESKLPEELQIIIKNLK